MAKAKKRATPKVPYAFARKVMHSRVALLEACAGDTRPTTSSARSRSAADRREGGAAREAHEEEGQEDDASAHQADIEVELEVWLLVLGPGERDVGQEPGDALVDHVGLKPQGQQAVPEAPQAVAVDWTLLGGRRGPH